MRIDFITFPLTNIKIGEYRATIQAVAAIEKVEAHILAGILTKELKSRFSSIEMVTEIPYVFKFADESDEAAFIMWSCDGIDI